MLDTSSDSSTFLDSGTFDSNSTDGNVLNNVASNLSSGYSDLDFQINLDFFSGPMDLLLHLVSQREVPIEKVCLKEVLDQYLEIVLEQADNLDLEKASEYLVIAATLMVIKSRSLIPQNAGDDEVGDDLPEYSRFFEDLRSRLIAFENIRLKAQALIETPQLDVDTFVRRDKSILNVPPEMIAEGEEPGRLGKLFLSLIKRVGGLARTYSISIEPISIVSYMMKLVDSLKTPLFSGRTSLLKLATTLYKKDIADNKTDSSRNIVLGSFIAVLELAKRGLIKVSQSSENEVLELELSMKEFEGSEFDSNEFKSEFDSQDYDLNDESMSDENGIPNLKVVNGNTR